MFSFGQASLMEPDKYLLIKNKIKKYETETKFYFNNSDTAAIGLDTFLLNDFGSIITISGIETKTVYEYVHDMLPASISVYNRNSNIPIRTTNYLYDSDYILQEELKFDSLDNLIHHKIYDKYGNIIEEMDFDFTPVTKSNTKIMYSEEGNILESKKYSTNGNSEIAYFYKDGVKIREESFYDDEYKHYFIEYFIYENKQLISHHNRHSNKYPRQKFELRNSTQYRYDQEGRLIKKRSVYNIKNPKDIDDKIGFSIDDYMEGNTKIVTYGYNDMGLISNIFSTMDGKPFIVFSCKYYK